jgi:hypothetical protein
VTAHNGSVYLNGEDMYSHFNTTFRELEEHGNVLFSVETHEAFGKFLIELYSKNLNTKALTKLGELADLNPYACFKSTFNHVVLGSGPVFVSVYQTEVSVYDNGHKRSLSTLTTGYPNSPLFFYPHVGDPLYFPQEGLVDSFALSNGILKVTKEEDVLYLQYADGRDKLWTAYCGPVCYVEQEHADPREEVLKRIFPPTGASTL